MSEGYNRVIILGNIGQDPDLRFTQGGMAILNLRMAASEKFADASGERKERTEWFSVVIFGKRADALYKLLRKGERILVEGSLRSSSFEGRDGQTKYKTEVIASNVVLCGGGKRDAGDSRRAPAAKSPPAKSAPMFAPDDDDPVSSLPF